MREEIVLDLDRYPLSMSEFDWKPIRLRDLEIEHPELSPSEMLRTVGAELLVRWDAQRERDRAAKERLAARAVARAEGAEERETVPLSQHIGRRVAAERIYARKKQEDLARAVRIGQSSLSDIERGVRPVSAAELVLIAEELGLPVTEFIGKR